MSKRRIDNTRDTKKKNLDELTHQLYSTSNEWPVYNHPDGGIIKITPWGSIRQFELNGEMITKFEDMSFTDYNFTPAIKNSKNPVSPPSHPQDQHLPQTPQSIQSLRLSPCDEAENYVMKGYQSLGSSSSPNVPSANDDFQFAREPEHYFGMMDDLELHENDMVM